MLLYSLSHSLLYVWLVGRIVEILLNGFLIYKAHNLKAVVQCARPMLSTPLEPHQTSLTRDPPAPRGPQRGPSRRVLWGRREGGGPIGPRIPLYSYSVVGKQGDRKRGSGHMTCLLYIYTTSCFTLLPRNNNNNTILIPSRHIDRQQRDAVYSHSTLIIGSQRPLEAHRSLHRSFPRSFPRCFL
jgi:hypothetical protein